MNKIYFANRSLTSKHETPAERSVSLRSVSQGLGPDTTKKQDTNRGYV